MIIKVGIDCRVIEAEVGAEIDDLESKGEEFFGKRSCSPVREGEEGKFSSGCGYGGHVGLNKGEFGSRVSFKSGKDLAHLFSRVRARGDGHYLGFGMAKDQAQELEAGVSASPDDRNFGGSRHLSGLCDVPGRWASAKEP